MYAPVTGYDTIFTQSQAPNYATGVERAENALLTGTGSQLAFRNFIDMITNKPQKGATVQLTINSKAQLDRLPAAGAGPRGKTINGKQQVGGVVALNPSTGAILAMASYPSYDPNQLAVHDTTKLNKIDTAAQRAEPEPAAEQRDPDHPAARLDVQDRDELRVVHAGRDQEPEHGGRLAAAAQAAQREHAEQRQRRAVRRPGRARPRSLYAFAQSCNTPFAKLGIQLGGPTIKSMATTYGLNNPSALDIPGVTVAPSNFTAEPDQSFTAFDAIGQHDTTVTPLQEAMFAATVANGGTLMKPYLIQQVTASDLSVVEQTQPQQLSQPISSTVAGYEKQMMIDGRAAAGGNWLRVQRRTTRTAWSSPARPARRRTA